jgi:hypothetical protein
LRRRLRRHAAPHTRCVFLAETAGANQCRHSVHRLRHVPSPCIVARSPARIPSARVRLLQPRWITIAPPSPGRERPRLDLYSAAGWITGKAPLKVLEDGEEKQHARLRSALGELCPHPPGQLPTTRKVGYALRRFRGRVVGGRKLQTRVAAGNDLWFVQHVGSPEPVEPSTLALPLDAADTDDVNHAR